jgi:hypothetical protein
LTSLDLVTPDGTKVSRNVLDIRVFGLVVKDLGPKGTGLLKVDWIDEA